MPDSRDLYKYFFFPRNSFLNFVQEITVSPGAAYEAKNLLTDMIIEKNSPEDNRLLVLNYAIDLFESDTVKFTPDEIHAFIEQFSFIENLLTYQGTRI